MVSLHGDADGTVKMDWCGGKEGHECICTGINCANQTDAFTLRGNPLGEVYTPTFTYHGAVEPDQCLAEFDDRRYIYMWTNMEASDTMLSSLWHNGTNDATRCCSSPRSFCVAVTAGQCLQQPRTPQPQHPLRAGWDVSLTACDVRIGFRYVQVEGWPESDEPTAQALTALFVHSALQATGSVHFNASSMQVLNGIQRAYVFTQLSNVHGHPTVMCVCVCSTGSCVCRSEWAHCAWFHALKSGKVHVFVDFVCVRRANPFFQYQNDREQIVTKFRYRLIAECSTCARWQHMLVFFLQTGACAAMCARTLDTCCTLAHYVEGACVWHQDCPTREKRGWTGDSQLTAGGATLNFDTAAFYANWVTTMRDHQTVNCALAGTSPAFPQVHPRCALSRTECLSYALLCLNAISLMIRRAAVVCGMCN